jgi:hypothetical protein
MIGIAQSRRMSIASSLIVAAVALAATAPARSALARQCPRVSGPPVHLAGKTLSHYVIGANGGVGRAFARSWVSKILHEDTPTSTIAKPSGAAGWECIANARQHVAFNGSCRNGSKSFSWGAA